MCTLIELNKIMQINFCFSSTACAAPALLGGAVAVNVSGDMVVTAVAGVYIVPVCSTIGGVRG